MTFKVNFQCQKPSVSFYFPIIKISVEEKSFCSFLSRILTILKWGNKRIHIRTGYNRACRVYAIRCTVNSGYEYVKTKFLAAKDKY